MSLESSSSDIKDNEAAASLASPDVTSKEENSLKSEQVIDKRATELSAPISPPIPSPTIEENGSNVNGKVDKMDVDEDEVDREGDKEAEKAEQADKKDDEVVKEVDEGDERDDEADKEANNVEKETDKDSDVSDKVNDESANAEKEEASEQSDKKYNQASPSASLSPNSYSEKHDRPTDDSETNGVSKKLKNEEGDAVKVEEEETANDITTSEASKSDSKPNVTATATSQEPKEELTRDYSHLDPTEPSDQPLPKHQTKFALSVVRSVKRLKDAAPFTQPVDPIKLGIPTYHDYVKEPMDLSTIEKKLSSNEYLSVAAFVHDFDLVISNCILFNGEESFISNMARGLASSFHKHMTNMPRYDSSATGPIKAKKKSSIIPSSSPAGTPKPQRAAAVAANAANAAGGSISSIKDEADDGITVTSITASTPTTQSPVNRRTSSAVDPQKPFALQPSGIPTIRRDSAIEGGRPKREIHPPKSKDLPYGDIKPRRKKFAAELKFCGQVLKELFSKKYEAYSFPFLQPVDPVALNCPTYFKIIKEPMDLSTVQDKYNKNEYESADEFERDVRLIFKNCYKFNPDGSPVNVMGHKLEAVFDKKWQEKPLPAPSPPIFDSSDEDYSDYEDEINESRITNPAIKFLEEQLEQIKSQLATLRKEAAREAREARRNSIAAKKRRKSGKATADGRRKSSAVGGRRGSLSGLNAPIHITYEMKKELSEKIGVLPEKKLRHVVGIIEESMPQLKNSAQDEIELDMDQLDPTTLMRLYNLVVKREEKKSKPSKTSTSSSSRKKKNKPLSEAEQSRQLEELQKKIKQFDRMKDGSSDGDSSSDEGAGGNNVMSSDDSSSEEE